MYGLRPQGEDGWRSEVTAEAADHRCLTVGSSFGGSQQNLKKGEKGEDARAMRLRDIVAADIQPRFLPSPHQR